MSLKGKERKFPNEEFEHAEDPRERRPGSSGKRPGLVIGGKNYGDGRVGRNSARADFGLPPEEGSDPSKN